MPIYEYHCDSCGHEFEQLVRTMTESDTQKCPQCGHSKSQRKLSVFSSRQGSQQATPGFPASGCGRCGDPNGPCSN